MREADSLQYGIRANRRQVAQQAVQVFFVGATLGLTRTVVPALSETEFGVAGGSFMLLGTFVIAFGLVKSVMNFAAGRLAEWYGRKPVLLSGWLLALPIPAMIFLAPNWWWIVAATFMLGINQGLTWSMTQAIKLDLTRKDQRGLVIGLNEFSGYVGVALAGLFTAYLAEMIGPRVGLLYFGYTVLVLAILSTMVGVKESRPWATTDSAAGGEASTWNLFGMISWKDKRFAALCQAGLVEKFVDTLLWIFVPLFLFTRSASLSEIGLIVGIYGVSWGVLQLATGKLSDIVGRRAMNVWGMWVSGAGCLLFLVADGTLGWATAALVAGIGMAMLYPNLSAAIADLAHPSWQASAIGIYRFWRDLGYAVGAGLLASAAALAGAIEAAFIVTGLAMIASGAYLLRWSGPVDDDLNEGRQSAVKTVR